MSAQGWVLHEDEHVVAVDKPAGVTTHRADAGAQDGVVEHLARRRGERLAVLHRLDKETSGVLAFGRSPEGTRDLARAFESRTAEKRYLLLCAADPARPRRQAARAPLPVRPGRRSGGPEVDAETELTVLERGAGHDLVEARPRTGRTHQVRAHAAQLGLPVLGDARYGGAPAARVFLHAAELRARVAGADLVLRSPRPASFDLVLAGRAPLDPLVAAVAAREARACVAADTDAYVWLDRHHDGVPDLHVERLGQVALVVRADERDEPLPRAFVEALLSAGASGVVERRRPRRGPGVAARVLAGDAPLRFDVVEHGLRFGLDLEASETSTGLFLDQREARRRLAGLALAGREVLNAFAHTGSLSVAAARAGARTLTLDLSARYLDWARENLHRNGLDPAEHDFLRGDALEWLARLARQGRRFDVVLLDPPSFSRSKRGGAWSAERDLGRLVALGARLAAPGGTLYVSTNLRRMRHEAFARHVEAGLADARRPGEVEPVSLPLDFRTGPGDPPYLKAAWVRLT